MLYEVITGQIDAPARTARPALKARELDRPCLMPLDERPIEPGDGDLPRREGRGLLRRLRPRVHPVEDIGRPHRLARLCLARSYNFV